MLGALGALLMVVGDLALSIIHSDKSDRGLYVREAYMIGSYQLWRPVPLFATGLVGMFFYSFGIKAILDQIDPKCRKSRAVMKYGGLAYICTGALAHFFIGTLSYWMTVFSAEFGRETAVRLVDDYYSRFMPAASIAYPFIALLFAGRLHFDSFKPHYSSQKNASVQHTPMAADTCACPRYPSDDISKHHHHGLRNEPVIGKSCGSYHVRIPVHLAYKE